MAKKISKVKVSKDLMLNSPDIKKYTKLMGAVDYDHEAAEQLADALNEINQLKLRQAQLEQLVSENPELHQFVWHTLHEGVLALHNIEDDHLTNIMMHLLRTHRAIPRSIRNEAVGRGLTVPATLPVGYKEDLEWKDAIDQMFPGKDVAW